MAAFSHEVYSYGNVDGLVGIFTAVKLIMGSSDFDQLIQLAVVIGFIVVSIAALNPKHWTKGWAWLVQVAIISSIAFIPKANVTIIDRLGIQPAQVVSDVPYALALLASIKSNVGDRLTSLFEQGFQSVSGDAALPPELSYRENGMMFGNKLVAKHLESRFNSTTVEQDVANYIRNCFLPVVGKTGFPTEDQVIGATTNLWALMANTNAALFTSYHGVGGAMTTASCADVYPILNGKVTADIVTTIQTVAPSLYPTMTPAMATSTFNSALVAAVAKTKLADASATANDLILTSALRNTFGSANAADALSTGDATAMLEAFSQSQGTAALNASMKAEGSYAEQALPIMRNITDSLLMAVFPIVVILLVMSEGAMAKKMAVGYLLASVWVELWPPMFAVVNFMATNSSARELAASTTVAGGLTMANAAQIYGGAISATAMVGKYLNMVPFLAGALLFGMDRMITGGGMNRAPVDSAANAAGEVAKGNASGGNISMDKRSLAVEEQSAYMRKREYANGTTFENPVTGEYRADWRAGTNSNVASMVMDSARTWREQSTLATEAGKEQMAQYERGIDSSYNQAVGFMSGMDRKRTVVNGVAVQDMASDGTSKEERRQTATQVAEKLGLGKDSQVVSALEAAMQAGIKTPDALKSLTGIDLQARIGATGKTATSESIARELSEGVNTLKQTGLARKEEVVRQYLTGDRFDTSRNSHKDATRKLEAGLKESVSAKNSAAAKFSESSRYSVQADAATKVGANVTSSFVTEFNNFLKLHGVTPGSASYNPVEGRRLLQEFLQTSKLFEGPGDPDSPQTMLISPMGGQGPRAIAGQPTPLQADAFRPDPGGVSPLKGRYDQSATALPDAVPTTPTAAAPVKADHKDQEGRVIKAARAGGVDPDTVVSDPKLKDEAKKAQEEAAKRMKEEQARQEEAERQQRAKVASAKGDLSLAQDLFGRGDGPARTTPTVNPDASGKGPIPGSSAWIPGSGDGSGDSPALQALTELNKQAARDRGQK